jgi:peptidylprolyl isomerase
MTLKLPYLALLAAITTAAIAQTTPTPKTPVTPRTTPATTKATVTGIPKIVGLPKTLYALKYVDIKIGTGDLAIPSTLGTSPADSKIMQYKVRYTGWLTNGTKFDSSDDHPGAAPLPVTVGLHRVIAGWDTGFTGMHIGGKRRLFIPWQLAYGEAGKPPTIPAKANLIFDIELISQEDITAQLTRRPTPQGAPTSPTAPKPGTPLPSSGAPQASPATPSTSPAAPPATPPAASPATPTPPTTPPHPEKL